MLSCAPSRFDGNARRTEGEIMAARPFPDPGPDEPRALTPREQEILAGIENDLTAAEPGLASRLSSPPSGSALTWPRSLTKGTRRLAGSLIFAMVVVFIPPESWLVVTLLTILLVAPVLIVRAIERGERE
jgi:DUF3040 family protein